MKTDFPNNLLHTRKAIKWYFSELQVSKRKKLLNDVMDDESMLRWEIAEKEDLQRVQRAFFEDTKEINSLDKCMLMDVLTLKKWCEKVENKKCY